MLMPFSSVSISVIQLIFDGSNKYGFFCVTVNASFSSVNVNVFSALLVWKRYWSTSVKVFKLSINSCLLMVPPWIKGKGGVHSVVSNRTTYDTLVAGEDSKGLVPHHKINLFFRRAFEKQAVAVKGLSMMRDQNCICWWTFWGHVVLSFGVSLKSQLVLKRLWHKIRFHSQEFDSASEFLKHWQFLNFHDGDSCLYSFSVLDKFVDILQYLLSALCVQGGKTLPKTLKNAISVEFIHGFCTGKSFCDFVLPNTERNKNRPCLVSSCSCLFIEIWTCAWQNFRVFFLCLYHIYYFCILIKVLSC